MLRPNGQQGKLMSDLPLYAQAMLRPDFYPEPTTKVELVQTQMSFVFLTDHFAYKTKKAVNLGYLDYSELSGRKALSEKELLLNRRLCDYAYLEVLPIIKNEGVIRWVDVGRWWNIPENAKITRRPHACKSAVNRQCQQRDAGKTG